MQPYISVQALDLHGGYLMLGITWGFPYASLKNFAEAVTAFDQAIAVNPQSYDALYQKRAGVLSEQGNYPKAVAGFSRAIAVDGGQRDSHFAQGLAYAALGRHEEALASFDRSLAIDPEFADGYYNRVSALKRRLGRYEESVPAFDGILSRVPGQLCWMVSTAAWHPNISERMRTLLKPLARPGKRTAQ